MKTASESTDTTNPRHRWSVPPGGLERALHYGAAPSLYLGTVVGSRWYRAQ